MLVEKSVSGQTVFSQDEPFLHCDKMKKRSLTLHLKEITNRDINTSLIEHYNEQKISVQHQPII